MIVLFMPRAATLMQLALGRSQFARDACAGNVRLDQSISCSEREVVEIIWVHLVNDVLKYLSWETE